MALNLPQVPFKLNPQDMGNFDLGSAIRGGLNINKGAQEARVMPEMLRAKINEMQGAAQKNLMMSKLFESLMGSGGGIGGGFGTEGGSEGSQPNLKAAVLKAFTGIDPYLMSPQQEQNLKIQGANKQLASKLNTETGSNDVAREFLQDKVSMPKEYMGAFGEASVLKDRLKASQGDKDAQERLIQAGIAEKLVPEYAGFQLLSQGQKSTVSGLKHQGEAIRQGWPKGGQYVFRNLPPELQKEVERRHNEIVKGVNRTRKQFLDSGGVRPETESKGEIIPPEGAGIVLMKNGKPHMIPADKVEDAINNWGYSYE